MMKLRNVSAAWLNSRGQDDLINQLASDVNEHFAPYILVLLEERRR